MAAQLEHLIEDVKRALGDPELVDEVLRHIPDLGPECRDVERLFAWGEAITRTGDISPELSDILIRLAKRHAHNS